MSERESESERTREPIWRPGSLVRGAIGDLIGGQRNDSIPHPEANKTWTPPTPEELRVLLPEYQVQSMLGRGGMGAVYRGKQKALDRPVAIKLLPEFLARGAEGRHFVERFKREAKAMGSLDHPGIISIFEFGQTPTGNLFFVMEFVEGMDLLTYLARSGGKLEWKKAVDIVSNVLDALGYAHAKGIVHRDIKPANILIDLQGRVRIADFGIAKQIEATGTVLTNTNVVIGTPDYMAPELLLGASPIDARADIFAIGVTLYQLLTGRLPRGMFKLPGEENSTIEPRLDDIIAKALEPDPNHRIANARVFRSRLDELSTSPVDRIPSRGSLPSNRKRESALQPAVPPLNASTRNRLKGKGKMRTDLALACLLVFILVLGVGGALYFLTGSESEKSVEISDSSRKIHAPPDSSEKDLESIRPTTPKPETDSTPRIAEDTKSFVSAPSPPVSEANQSSSKKPPSITNSQPEMTDRHAAPANTAAPEEPWLFRIPGIEERIGNYQKARSVALEELLDQFERALKSERARVEQIGGDAELRVLDGAIASTEETRKVLGQFSTSHPAPLPAMPGLSGNVPNSLRRLRTIFDEESRKREAELAAKFDQSLEALQLQRERMNDSVSVKRLEKYREEISLKFPQPEADSVATRTKPAPAPPKKPPAIPLAGGGKLRGWNAEPGKWFVDLKEAEQYTDCVSVHCEAIRLTVIRSDGRTAATFLPDYQDAHPRKAEITEIKITTSGGRARFGRNKGATMTINQLGSIKVIGYSSMKPPASSRACLDALSFEQGPSLSLLKDGTLAFWLPKSSSSTAHSWPKPPLKARSDIVAISASRYIAAAVNRDGEIFAWSDEGLVRMDTDRKKFGDVAVVEKRVYGLTTEKKVVIVASSERREKGDTILTEVDWIRSGEFGLLCGFTDGTLGTDPLTARKWLGLTGILQLAGKPPPEKVSMGRLGLFWID